MENPLAISIKHLKSRVTENEVTATILYLATSHKDKDGNDIYEHDIIEANNGTRWLCIFKEGCFWLYRPGSGLANAMRSWPVDCYPMFRVDHSQFSKVIGNLHKNPELWPQ